MEPKYLAELLQAYVENYTQLTLYRDGAYFYVELRDRTGALSVDGEWPVIAQAESQTSLLDALMSLTVACVRAIRE